MFLFLLLYLCCAFYHQIAKRLQKGYQQKERLDDKKKNGKERMGLGVEMRVDSKNTEREQYGITKVYKGNGRVCDFIYLPCFHFEDTLYPQHLASH